MNYKKAYRCKVDLKMLREAMKLSKEFVADEIGYSVRNFERIEKNNAVSSEEAARRICTFYKMEYAKVFDRYDDKYHIGAFFKYIGTTPKNQIRKNETYYLLYVKKMENFEDCVLGKVGWLENCGKNMERRKLRSVDPRGVVECNPGIIILNERSEWENWYYNLIVGKWNKVMISESCLSNCMRSCLDEMVVNCDELLKFDGYYDMAFLGVKKRSKRKLKNKKDKN